MMHPQIGAHWVRLGKYWIFLLAASLVPVVVVFGSLEDPGLAKKALSFSGVGVWLIVLTKLYVPPMKRRSRDKKLIAAALAGRPPTDGARTAILGVARSDSPLTSPISDRPCVAFAYHIYHHQEARDTRSLSTHRVTKGVAVDTYHCSGYHLAESTIETGDSSFKLLGFPILHGVPQTFAKSYGDEAARAAALRASTEFEPAKLRDAMRELKEDDSGQISRDWCMKPLPDDRAGLVTVDIFLPLNTEVCAIGTYDAARGGLVAGKDPAASIRILEGDGESALSQLGLWSWLQFWT